MRTLQQQLAYDEVQRLLARIAKVFVPGVKLTLVVRSPADPTGDEDHVFTDDRIEDAVTALQQAAARRDRQGAVRTPVDAAPTHNED
jgi:hypothetical protein